MVVLSHAPELDDASGNVIRAAPTGDKHQGQGDGNGKANRMGNGGLSLCLWPNREPEWSGVRLREITLGVRREGNRGVP